MAVSRGFSFFFQDETITKVSIGEEGAKLWLLPLSFRLQEFADCLVRAHSRLLDLLDIYVDFIEPFHMTSRPILVSHVVPYWCLKTLKRRSCRFHKEILWKLNH